MHGCSDCQDHFHPFFMPGYILKLYYRVPIVPSMLKLSFCFAIDKYLLEHDFSQAVVPEFGFDYDGLKRQQY